MVWYSGLHVPPSNGGTKKCCRRADHGDCLCSCCRAGRRFSPLLDIAVVPPLGSAFSPSSYGAMELWRRHWSHDLIVVLAHAQKARRPRRVSRWLSVTVNNKLVWSDPDNRCPSLLLWFWIHTMFVEYIPRVRLAAAVADPRLHDEFVDCCCY